MERKHKKATRESYEIGIKDKKSNLKSMRAARMSADFKAKEKYANRSARESDEMRAKDKKPTLTSMRAARMSGEFKAKEKKSKKIRKSVW